MTNEESWKDQDPRTIIKDKVDPCKLLHHLQTDSTKCTSKIAGWAPETTVEAVRPRRKVSCLWYDAQLILVVGNDFRKLVLNVFRIDWLSSNIGKSASCIIKLAFLYEVTWRLWKQEEANAKDKSPEELDSDGNSV